MNFRVILFVFAGRRPNMELQLPFARRILEEHPNTEYHVWNLAREREIRSICRPSKAAHSLGVISDSQRDRLFGIVAKMWPRGIVSH